MADKPKRRPPTTGTGADDLHQEIELIVQQVSREPWVVREAELLQEARDIRAAWNQVLGLRPSRPLVIV